MNENRIQYKEPCPLCASENQDQKLFLDMDKVEIRCELGHIFEELPSDKALRTGQAAQAESAQIAMPENEPSGGGSIGPGIVPEGLNQAHAEFVSDENLMKNRASAEPGVSNTLENKSSVEDVEVSPEEDSARMAALTTKLAEENQRIAGRYGIDLGKLPPLTAVTSRPIVPVTVEGQKTFVSEETSITLPDGDLLLCVRIPEAWKSAVEAEAEAQMKSPGAYFSDWLTSTEMRATLVDWLENYWVSNWTQTKG